MPNDIMTGPEAKEAQDTILRALNEAIGRRVGRIPAGDVLIAGPLDDLDGSRAKGAAVRLFRAVEDAERRLGEVERHIAVCLKMTGADETVLAAGIDVLLRRLTAMGAERDELRRVLEFIEWGGTHQDACPVCGYAMPDHFHECGLNAALAATEDKPDD